MNVGARTVRLQLAETFVISRSAQNEAELVDVEIEHDGVVGVGEAAPIERYDESANSALAYIEEQGDALGDEPFALDEILDRLPREQFAARAAIDAALHDLQGKLTGLPVWRLLGLRRAGPPTSWTIWLGDPDDMARRAEKVDVNEAWTMDEALDALPQLAEAGVQYCEQPLPAGDTGAPELKRRSPVPIFVDEDCHTLSDVARCSERAHGINIKLAKSGGIREGVRMAHAARALGVGVMLGCMVESGLGIAAGAQMASLCDHVDLDGNLLLAEDPWPGIELCDGVQLPSEQPGLGVHAEVLDPR